MPPKVVLHTEISIDGKANGFEVDMGLYYRLAETFAPDCTISGSNTILAAEMPDPVPEWCHEAAAMYPSCSRMIMAIVDGRGRIDSWAAIKKQPFWRMAVALVSSSTPAEYLESLRREGVDYIVAGKKRVDLRAALDELGARYGVESVRIDSGGKLASVMLSQGLIDELSMLLSPCVAGSLGSASFLDPGNLVLEKPVDLELMQLEKMDDGHVWARYKVVK